MKIGNIVIINVKSAVKAQSKMGLEFQYLTYRILTGASKLESHRMVRKWVGKWFKKEMEKEIKEGIR